jgi:hypothetical protein
MGKYTEFETRIQPISQSLPAAHLSEQEQSLEPGVGFSERPLYATTERARLIRSETSRALHFAHP